MALKRQTFDDGAEDTTITVANSASSGDALTAVSSVGSATGFYSSSAASRGIKGAAIGGNLNDTFTLSISDTAAASASAQVYFKIPTYPGVGGAFFRIRSTTANVAIIRLEDNGVLAVQDATGLNLKSLNNGTPLALETIYRINLQATAGTTTTDGYIAAQLYDNANNLIDSYIGSNVNAGTNQSLQYAQAGKVVAGSDQFSIYVDELAIDMGTTSQIAPVVNITASILKRQTFDAGAQGNEITASNSADSGDTLDTVVKAGAGMGVYDSAAGLRGSKGAHVTGSLNDTFQLILSNTSSVSATAQIYFRLLALPTASGVFFRLRSSTGNVAIFIIDTSGVLQLQNAVGTTIKLFLSNTPLTLNTTYRAQLQATPNASTTGGFIAGQLYSDNDTLLDSFSSSTVNAGTTLNVQTTSAGKVVSISDGFNMAIDELAFNTGTVTEIPPVAKTVANRTPTVTAGHSHLGLRIRPQTFITLSASAADPDGTVSSVSWTQISGSPSVTLTANGTSATFTAPAVRAGTTLRFRATATDGVLSATDEIDVSVLPQSEWAVRNGLEVEMFIDIP